MAKAKTLQTEIKSLKNRLLKQEKTLSELRGLMIDIRKGGIIPLQDSMKSIPTHSDLSTASNLLSVYERGPNPWTIQTSKTLDDTINAITSEVHKKVAKKSFDTYEKTLKALLTSKKGLTAEEVGKQTKRNRNTESTYLWRLYLAELIEREKIGNKVVYRLKSESNLGKIIGKVR